MDKVFIKGLVLHSLIGVYDFERNAKQRVIIDVEIEANLKPAGLSDQVTDTLDYGVITERLTQIADTASYQLLEALGEEMVEMILQEFNANAVSLTINKPDILEGVDAVGIVLNRCKASADNQMLANKKAIL